MKNLVKKLTAEFQSAGLSDPDKKEVLRLVLAECWPKLPVYSGLNEPKVEEVQKASVGSGVLLTFKEDGVRKVVLVEAGSHYKVPNGKPAYTVPGGFIDLTRTEGSSLVKESSSPESPQKGGVREVEEEVVKPNGDPVLNIDPSRLRVLDAKTVPSPFGEPKVVLSFILELEPNEIESIKAHVSKLESDAEYKHESAQQTINPASGLPEVAGVKIFNLGSVAWGECNLLHKDQLSLFQKAHHRFSNDNSSTCTCEQKQQFG